MNGVREIPKTIEMSLKRTALLRFRALKLIEDLPGFFVGVHFRSSLALLFPGQKRAEEGLRGLRELNENRTLAALFA